MKTVAQLFTHALQLLPPADRPRLDLPNGGYCTLRNCGRPLTAGYAVTDIITDATNEIVDTFCGNPSGLLCPDCAALFTQDHNLGAWLIFADGTAYNPLISRDSATAASSRSLLAHNGLPDPNAPVVKRAPKFDRSQIPRPAWSDLVRDIWPHRRGQELVILLTTNTKKRQWPRAKVGALGPSTPLYLHDGPDEASRSIRWSDLVYTLNIIEPIYAQGFSKEAIRSNLLQATKAVAEIGFHYACRQEQLLRPLRVTAEFAPALLIAQKPMEPSS